MKIKLQCGQHPTQGFVNIDSRPNLVAPHLTQDIEFVVGSYGNLDPIINNGECDEIIFAEPLNTIDPQSLVKIVAHWNDKLKNNGILIIYFIDIDLTAKSILKSQHDDEMINSCLLGPQNDFNSVLDLSTLENAFKAVGYKIFNREYPNEVAIKLTLKKA